MKSRKKKSSVDAVFWTLAGIFALITLFIIAPNYLKRRFFPVAAVLGFAFFVCGLLLVYLTLKLKVKGKEKWFLIITGASAAGVLVGAVLHNVVYGLFIALFGADFWIRTGLGDEPFFFIFALIVCPIGFLVGAIGRMLLLVKKKS